MPDSYLFLFYSLPTEPSRIRVAVWRALKKLGALNVQQSLWMLPHYPGAGAEIEQIRELVEKNGGSIFVVEGAFRYGIEKIAGRFNQEREKEYRELLGFCQRFHAEIQAETARSNFTFAELEENEEELAKLLSWRDKIRKRDCFQAPLAARVEAEIEQCRRELEAFAQQVYEANDLQ